MYLQKLEIQGFKSFAQKTVLEFMSPFKGKCSNTGIVGPNGSGKSNVADAIRWVLGEQSLKLLRGKKSEDVIFSGSDKKSRMGFAQVTLTLNNEDGTIKASDNEDTALDFSEIAITRRVYRSGESDYMINGNKVRLADIQMLLARAHFAEKSYTVIGQGMIDHMLQASPAERKKFFDEAAGIKEFQIKRHHAVLKLHATKENLHETKMLLQEIEPRLNSLRRQVKRLEKREVLEKELNENYLQYYGSQLVLINEKYQKLQKQNNELDAQKKSLNEIYENAFAKMRALEVEETANDGYSQLQKEYEQAYQKKSQVREEILQLKNAVEIAKMRAQTQKKFTPLPLSKIISELEILDKEVKSVETQEEISRVKSFIQKISQRIVGLLKNLQQPAPEKIEFKDEKAEEQIQELEKTLVILEGEIKDIQNRIHDANKQESKNKSAFFSLQKDLQEKQHELHKIEQHASSVAIEFARVQTRRETLLEEIDREVPQMRDALMRLKKQDIETVQVSDLQTEVYRLRRQLELIGSIDDETVQEYKETSERFEFLSEQVGDLDSAMSSIEKAIGELDEVMTKRRKSAFTAINKEFDRFFKILFDGGKSGIVEIKAEKKSKSHEHLEEDEEIEKLEEELGPAEEELAGIDIFAQPPGKRIKDINVLSGGERALTSVALVCAILSTNPSPFVVLDEVDAALDESNSIRFAEIVGELAAKTQFIIITHNRATMEKGDVLYGVTMSDDSVSHVLSIKLEDATSYAK